MKRYVDPLSWDSENFEIVKLGSLGTERSYGTATLVPGGSIWIVGGIGPDSEVA